MSTVINAEHVYIRYKTGDFQAIGLKEYIMRKLTHTYVSKDFLAVSDVSFKIEKGEMLGIVGENGAGKSTLLKVISGIMVPSAGVVECHGTVAALLELGSGFDGELSVKENTYLRGALMGYPRKYIDERYSEILDFSELTEFEDRPFRQLSSGMQARLAFSIASVVQPEILILDEVLAVGDARFQQKSAAKMRSIIKSGATTVFVSHSIDQVRELCTKVLWLDHGKQRAFGDTEDVMKEYEQFLALRM